MSIIKTIKKIKNKNKTIKIINNKVNSFIIYPNNNNNIKKLIKWTNEDDVDDFTEINDLIINQTEPRISKRNIYIINYKIVNDILFSFNFSLNDNPSILTQQIIYNYKEGDFIPFIKLLYNFIKENNENNEKFYEYLSIIANSIIKLIYDYKKLLINIDTYLLANKEAKYKIDNIIKKQKSPDYFNLYRGFNYKRYKLLLDYVKKNIENKNDRITIPAILSSSIYFQTANRFASNEEEIGNNIIWIIKIKKEVFDKFKYSYLGTEQITLNILENLNINNIVTKEAEFLLNYGMILKFIKQDIKTDINKTIYYFEFIDYDEKSINDLKRNLNIHIDNTKIQIENEEIKKSLGGKKIIKKLKNYKRINT